MEELAALRAVNSSPFTTIVGQTGEPVLRLSRQ